MFTKEQLDVNALEVKLRFDQDECHMLKDVEITPAKTVSRIIKLKENMSPGVHNIVLIVLKRVAKDISTRLCTIFRKSLDTGKFQTVQSVHILLLL